MAGEIKNNLTVSSAELLQTGPLHKKMPPHREKIPPLHVETTMQRREIVMPHKAKPSGKKNKFPDPGQTVEKIIRKYLDNKIICIYFTAEKK